MFFILNFVLVQTQMVVGEKNVVITNVVGGKTSFLNVSKIRLMKGTIPLEQIVHLTFSVLLYVVRPLLADVAFTTIL